MNGAEQARVFFWALAGAILGAIIAFYRLASINQVLGGGLPASWAWSEILMFAIPGGVVRIVIGILMVLICRKPKGPPPLP